MMADSEEHLSQQVPEVRSGSAPPQTLSISTKLNSSSPRGSGIDPDRNILRLTPSDEVEFDANNPACQGNSLLAKLQIKNTSNKSVVVHVRLSITHACNCLFILTQLSRMFWVNWNNILFSGNIIQHPKDCGITQQKSNEDGSMLWRRDLFSSPQTNQRIAQR